jgi:hypothetical protein
MEGVIVVAELSTCSESSGEWLTFVEASDIAADEVAAATAACST